MGRKTLAYRDGFARGQNAAGWWTQEFGGGRDTRGNEEIAEAARKLLEGLEDGDPQAMDATECPVNLSGEWAGDMVPEDVASLYARRPSPETLDDLCSDWEAGAYDGWTGEIGRHLRSLVSDAS